MAYKVELTNAVLAGFHPKKATRTLKGEEHDPPKMVLVIEVDLDVIETHMRDIIGVYRFGGHLGQGSGPGVALDFPTRAEQRKLWESEVAAAAATGGTMANGPVPIGEGRKKQQEATT